MLSTARCFLLGEVDSIADVALAGFIGRCVATCVRRAAGVLLLLICDIIVVDRNFFYPPLCLLHSFVVLRGFALPGTFNTL